MNSALLIPVFPISSSLYYLLCLSFYQSTPPIKDLIGPMPIHLKLGRDGKTKRFLIANTGKENLNLL
jgi:hypothetical protein